jgi:hypothetical protein
MAEVKIINDICNIPKRRGNGILRREVWEDSKTHKVVRYNLAYINQAIASGDNGRVVGYDNAHGYHHRHYMGKVEPIEFTRFEDIEARFEAEWTALQKRKQK